MSIQKYDTVKEKEEAYLTPGDSCCSGACLDDHSHTHKYSGLHKLLCPIKFMSWNNITVTFEYSVMGYSPSLCITAYVHSIVD